MQSVRLGGWMDGKKGKDLKMVAGYYSNITVTQSYNGMVQPLKAVIVKVNLFEI